MVGQIVSLGLSGFIMQITNSVAQVMGNSMLQIWGGDLYVGVMTVINSVRQVIMMPMQGLSEGMQPVVGYNYGAKRYDRVKSGIKFMSFICMGYAFLAWGVAELFPQALIRIFNKENALLEVGVPSLRMYFAAFFALWMQMAGQYSFVALGKAKQATFFSLLRKAFIVVPLTLILPKYVGVSGVFWAEVVSDLVGSAACFTTFMLTVWRRELNQPSAQ
jgi:Na+-driven multidrug efflux pump